MTRQRIILLIMVIVVFYGAYQLWFSSSDTTVVESSKRRLEELKSFVIDAATNLSNEYISAADKYIIEQAEKAWPQNPFLQVDTPLNTEPVQVKSDMRVETVQLSYTGFIQTADKTLAIVNGMEYEPGEQLSDAGYFIEQISPQQVILGNEDNPKRIVLSLDESVDIPLEP